MNLSDLKEGHENLTVQYVDLYNERGRKHEVRGWYKGVLQHPTLGKMLLLAPASLEEPYKAIPLNKITSIRKPVTPYVEVEFADG